MSTTGTVARTLGAVDFRWLFKRLIVDWMDIPQPLMGGIIDDDADPSLKHGSINALFN